MLNIPTKQTHHLEAQIQKLDYVNGMDTSPIYGVRRDLGPAGRQHDIVLPVLRVTAVVSTAPGIPAVFLWDFTALAPVQNTSSRSVPVTSGVERMGPRNHVLDGVHVPHRKGHF